MFNMKRGMEYHTQGLVEGRLYIYTRRLSGKCVFCFMRLGLGLDE